jgi:hypothetical protein
MQAYSCCCCMCARAGMTVRLQINKDCSSGKILLHTVIAVLHGALLEPKD